MTREQEERREQRNAMTLETGARYYIWRRTRIVTGKTRVRYGNVEYLCLPENLEKPGTPLRSKQIIGDWIEPWRVEKYGERLEAEDVRTDQTLLTVEERVEEAVAVERKRKVITPERRLANRITNTRHKMKHPEKYHRESWSAEELAEMEALIQTTQAELAAMREAA